MKDITNIKLIGKRMYPVDNSFSFTIGSNRKPFLAGTSNTKAKKVTIVSEPYTLRTKFMVEQDHEFVTVSYGRKLHVILNYFVEKLSETYMLDRI